eukprot:gb/GECG01015506.1/.p1 GENE.gb/GECG01015506.1/~~gb/GECG01015506.1/.p1  ORF type:complete len:136 (+),score=11.04 gb/GECG01015506.1/:1-408(+)
MHAAIVLLANSTIGPTCGPCSRGRTVAKTALPEGINQTHSKPTALFVPKGNFLQEELFHALIVRGVNSKMIKGLEAATAAPGDGFLMLGALQNVQPVPQGSLSTQEGLDLAKTVHVESTRRQTAVGTAFSVREVE